jgi:hypothetical protein
MAIRLRRELGLVVAWLVFPLVPVLLEDAYYQVCNFELSSSAPTGPDPTDWSWTLWLIMIGPLVGYGFMAGVTVDLPDDLGPTKRGWRRLLARRSVWVAIGPWCGFLFWAGVYFALAFVASLLPPKAGPFLNLPETWRGTWIETVVNCVLGLLFFGILAYGWLWPARAALRRAADVGRLSRATYHGLGVPVAFVGSLFGSFWAATALWRSYFFDSRVVPFLVMGLTLVFTSGCTSSITYGELRRRELFHAMLVAWVLGLALMSRWWSRKK